MHIQKHGENILKITESIHFYAYYTHTFVYLYYHDKIVFENEIEIKN